MVYGLYVNEIYDWSYQEHTLVPILCFSDAIRQLSKDNCKSFMIIIIEKFICQTLLKSHSTCMETVNQHHQLPVLRLVQLKLQLGEILFQLAYVCTNGSFGMSPARLPPVQIPLVAFVLLDLLQ